MRIQALYELSPAVERSVIINVATEVVTSLAIVSALRNLDMPLLVVNCTAEGVGKKFMDTLRDQWKFDLIDLPLAVHGTTIDRLFREVHVDRLTILDSDAEVRNPDTIKRMRAAFDDNTVYGAGYIHESTWLTEAESALVIEGQSAPVLYAERPWIPFATFRTSSIRAALSNGASFREMHALGADGLVVAPELLRQRIPTLVHGDTGAEIHGWLSSAGWRFAGPSVMDAGEDVFHYHGVTRKALVAKSGNATPLDQIENQVLARLRNEYGQYWAGFASAVKAAQP